MKQTDSTSSDAAMSSPTAKLSSAEQQLLKKTGLRKEQIKDLAPPFLAELTGISLERCHELVALHQFQTLDSVGPAAAADLFRLGYRSLDELRMANPRLMYERLCDATGVRHDPCVEDVFRAVVAQVEDPALPIEQRNWWYWTRHREGAGAGATSEAKSGNARGRKKAEPARGLKRKASR